jgi:hypothetical protein
MNELIMGAESSALAGKRERGKSNSFYLSGVVPANNSNSSLQLTNNTAVPSIGNIQEGRTPFPLQLRAYKAVFWIYNTSTATQNEIDTFYALVQRARISVTRQETVETLGFNISECLDVSSVNGIGAVQIQNLSKFQPITGDVQNFAMSESIKLVLENFASAGLPQVGFNIILKGITK